MRRATIVRRVLTLSLLGLLTLIVGCSKPEARSAGQTEQEQVSQPTAIQDQDDADSREPPSQSPPTNEDGKTAGRGEQRGITAQAEVDTVIIDLRLWQGVDDPTLLSLQARVVGDDRAFLARGTLTLSPFGGYAPTAKHPFTSVEIAGVGLHVHQREVEPERIFIRACATACQVKYGDTSWRPLGMIPFPLDDGVSEGGQFRFGDLRIAIPRGSPGLLKDREHLLALRDVFAADPPLDWSAATPASIWEGVTLSGSPPRVTELDLANRGLTGEIWGYLGDLTELQVLRLDGNLLRGWLPSKLQLLSKLKDLRLSGNIFTGCAPPSLQAVADFDLTPTDLPTCDDHVFGPPWHRFEGTADHLMSFGNGIHFLIAQGGVMVFEVPGNASVHGKFWDNEGCEHDGGQNSIFEDCAGSGTSLHYLEHREPHLVGVDLWVFVDTGEPFEVERSHYLGCIYDCDWWEPSAAARIERFAASIWLNPKVTQEVGFSWRWP